MDFIFAKEAVTSIQELNLVSELRFPRQSVYKGDSLHISIDASSQAFGAVGYSLNDNNSN